jgi:succinate-semialdehyde dehydrogenase/glutarate-semialdehyde dehydrogenase
MAEIILRETGKPAAEALTTEVLVVLDLARYYAAHAPKLLADEHFTPSNIALWRKRVTIRHEPHGVVGVIAPWNYPLMLAAGVILAALVARNAVLFKPSEYSPTTGVLIGELIAEAGFPEGLTHVLTGDGATGAAIIEAGVDKVFFIGSVATGRKVAAACAERLIPCVLELGGSDPAIVLEDADLATAASGIAWGRFSNAGQTCVAPKRVFVINDVYDRFVEQLATTVRALRVGPGSRLESDVGPLIRPSQVRQLESQLHDALALGARTVAGSERVLPDQGDFFPPTVLVDVTPAMRVVREETFGPIILVTRVSDADDAVRQANESSFGLSASVWSRDLRRAREVARRLDAGTVVINDAIVAAGSPRCHTAE